MAVERVSISNSIAIEYLQRPYNSPVLAFLIKIKVHGDNQPMPFYLSITWGAAQSTAFQLVYINVGTLYKKTNIT